VIIKVLKADSFGRVEFIDKDRIRQVRRVACGGRIPGSSLAARFLARREQTILQPIGINSASQLTVRNGTLRHFQNPDPG
jgi:hypothetical protein